MKNDFLTAELRRRSQGMAFVIELDMAESILRLGDYVSAQEVNNFTSSMFSVMLTSLVLDDTSESGDAIDRMISNYGIEMRYVQFLWGEFLLVLNRFYEHYRNYDLLVDNLRDLLGSDVYDTDPELMFSVTVRRGGRCLLVR